jgi:hypothetical protein
VPHGIQVCSSNDDVDANDGRTFHDAFHILGILLHVFRVVLDALPSDASLGVLGALGAQVPLSLGALVLDVTLDVLAPPLGDWVLTSDVMVPPLGDWARTLGVMARTSDGWVLMDGSCHRRNRCFDCLHQSHRLSDFHHPYFRVTFLLSY